MLCLTGSCFKCKCVLRVLLCTPAPVMQIGRVDAMHMGWTWSMRESCHTTQRLECSGKAGCSTVSAFAFLTLGGVSGEIWL
jgi:hypothetical protein